MSPHLKVGGSCVHNAVSRSVDCLGLNVAPIRFSGRPILPLETNGGRQNAVPLTGSCFAQCRPRDRFQTRPDFSGFSALSLSSSTYRARKMKTNQPSPHQWCRDENTFPACIRNSFAKPPALSALRRCIDTYFPDKMKHLFLCVDYTTKSCTIQAIIRWLFILTTKGGGFQTTFPVNFLPQKILAAGFFSIPNQRNFSNFHNQ